MPQLIYPRSYENPLADMLMNSAFRNSCCLRCCSTPEPCLWREQRYLSRPLRFDPSKGLSPWHPYRIVVMGKDHPTVAFSSGSGRSKNPPRPWAWDKSSKQDLLRHDSSSQMGDTRRKAIREELIIPVQGLRVTRSRSSRHVLQEELS